jgi:hypothetical protein
VFFAVCSLVAAVIAATNMHRIEFDAQYAGCEVAMSVSIATIRLTYKYGPTSSSSGLPAAVGPDRGLVSAFDALQERCFDQKWLSALQRDRAQFSTVRNEALDGWRYANQPASVVLDNATEEERRLDGSVDFIDHVLAPHLHQIEAPTRWDTLRSILGQDG